MKQFIVLLIAVLAMPAFAGTKAYTKNEGGGEIVLTDEPCESNDTMLRAYMYTNTHYTEEGCWRDDDRTIYTQWDKQGEKRYKKKWFRVANRW